MTFTSLGILSFRQDYTPPIGRSTGNNKQTFLRDSAHHNAALPVSVLLSHRPEVDVNQDSGSIKQQLSPRVPRNPLLARGVTVFAANDVK